MKNFLLLTGILCFATCWMTAQVQGTIIKTEADEVTVFAKPAASLTDVSLCNINFCISIPDQGLNTPTANITINHSDNLSWTVAGGNPDIIGGRAYYTFVGNDNNTNSLTTWNSSTDNPIVEITFSSSILEDVVRLDDLSPNGGGSFQSFWYVQIIGQGDITNYASMFYGEETVVNNGGASPSYVEAGNDITLPVEFLHFDANLTDKKDVLLNWKTASERNNSHFIVERSKNGVDFEEIARVEGAGNSTDTNDYTHLDEKPYNGISYYRIKQVDFDGKSDYSEIRIIKIDLGELVLYPNPTKDQLNIAFADILNGEVDLSIYNVSGQLMFDGKIQVLDGVSTLTLSDVNVHTPGVYVLAARQGTVDIIKQQKFVKVK